MRVPLGRSGALLSVEVQRNAAAVVVQEVMQLAAAVVVFVNHVELAFQFDVLAVDLYCRLRIRRPGRRREQDESPSTPRRARAKELPVIDRR